MADFGPAVPVRPTREERRQAGVDARERMPIASLGAWEPAVERDPIALLEAQCRSRVPELVPIKYGRMMVSPFTYFRGAPIVMASDLASQPHTDVLVQSAGDAHLLNFGLFASPERNLLFDLNDFDETHVAPWEWDLKRLTTSVVVAGRDNGFGDDDCRAAAHATASAYVTRIHEYDGMTNLHVWYSKIDAKAVDDVLAESLSAKTAESIRKRIDKGLRKAQHRTNLETLPKITEVVDGQPRIIDDPPLIHHLPTGDEGAAFTVFQSYRDTLRQEYRTLLDRYTPVDLVQKVVGVGSVGTRCYLLLLLGDDVGDPLFLQVKEAERSVLEPHTVPCRFENQGERVVVGQRLMQAASDVFLGWTKGLAGHDFYVRQLRDMKGSVRIDRLDPTTLRMYGALCAWTLARAHARASGPATVAGYLGDDQQLADAVTDFAVAYADQNEQDHEEFVDAVKGGRLFATPGF